MVEPGACDKCIACIGNYEGQDLYQPALMHPEFGAIWDLLLDHSLAHPNCRCKLTVTANIDWSTVPEIQELNAILTPEQQIPLKTEVTELIDVSQITETKTKLEGLNAEVKGMSMNYHQLREVETILNRTLEMIGQMSGGNKDLQKLVNILQRAILTVRALQMAFYSLQAAQGPIGWVLAGSSLLMGVVASGGAIAEISSSGG
jgi:hypothetical protein